MSQMLLLMSATAAGADLHWERLAAPGAVRGVAVSGEALIAWMEDGAILRHSGTAWHTLAAPGATGQRASRLTVSADGSIWLLSIDGSWAAPVTETGVGAPVQVPLSNLTSLDVDTAGRWWAAGLHGQLVVREGTVWTPIHGLAGNLLVQTAGESAWVWSTAGERLVRLTTDGERIGTHEGPRTWSSAWGAQQIDHSGTPLWGSSEGLFRGDTLLLAGQVDSVSVADKATWATVDGTPWRITDDGAEPVAAPLSGMTVLARPGGGAWGLAGDALWVTRQETWTPLQVATDRWGLTGLSQQTAVGDFDGDGLDDLARLTPDGRLQRWMQRDGRLEPEVPSPPSDATRLLTCDLDRSGRDDVLLFDGQLRVLRSTPTLQEITDRLTLPPLPSIAGRIGCGDLDGDGWPEVWLPAGGAPEASPRLTILHNTGHGRLAAMPMPARGLNRRDYIFALLPADLDRDGRLDMLLLNQWGRGSTLLAGRDGGRLQKIRSGLEGTYMVFKQAWLTDMDSDDALDLLAVTADGVLGWRNSDGLLVDHTADWNMLSIPPGMAATLFGDGLLTCPDDAPCQWWHRQDGRFTDRSTGLPAITGARMATALDLGGDGDADLLVETADGPWLLEDVTDGPRVTTPKPTTGGTVRRLVWAEPIDAVAAGVLLLVWLLAGQGRARAGAGVMLAGRGVLGAGSSLLIGLALLEQPRLLRMGWTAGSAGLAGVLLLSSVLLHQHRAAQRVAGYRLVRTLGRGGMGTVYLAVDETSGEKVALKVVHPDLLTDEADRQLYRHEAQIGADIVHPGVVRILGWGEWTVLAEDGQPQPTAYLVMELLSGQTLAEYRKKHGRLPPGEAAAIITAVCDALSALHRLDVVHRDVKPGNIMLVDGGIKLMDFGAARHVGQLTQEGRSILGTIGYLAPEQGQGSPPEPQADVYAVGVILHELLAGERPFEADDLVTMLSRILTEDAPLIPDIPEELQDVVDQALCRDPDARYPSVTALAETLAPFATAVPAPHLAHRPTLPRRALRGSTHPLALLHLVRLYLRYARQGGTPDPAAFAQTLTRTPLTDTGERTA